MKAGAKVLNIWKIGLPRMAVVVLYLLRSMGPINAKKASGRKMVWRMFTVKIRRIDG